ncbi:MAG: PAS domain S-box protein, partial [Anaerolineales bacterium]
MTDHLGLLRDVSEIQEASARFEQLRLLLVEDNPGDARLVEEAFRSQASQAQTDWDYQITVVERLDQAVREVVDRNYQLVLLDMGLPDSQGLDTVQKMREADPDTPIVVLTGHDDYEMALRTLRAGAQDYLVKGSFDNDALARSVRYALERTNLTERLAKREASNRQILSSLSAHIALLNERGQIVQTNRAWDQFSRENGGAPSLTGVGANYLDICREAEASDGDGTAQQALDALESVLSGEDQLASMEYPCHAPEVERWFTMWVTPLEAEAAGGVVVAHENITERRLAELELQRQSEELKTILGNTPDIIARYDLSGRHLYISPSIERFSGHPPDHYLGKTDQELDMPPERIRLGQESIQKVIETGQELQVEYQASYDPAREEAPRTFQANLVPEMDGQNQLQSILLVARDISELKAAKEKLESREDVLKAVSFSSNQYLSASHWRDVTGEVLKTLGQAAGAHRAYIWQNQVDQAGQLVASQIAEWAADPELALAGLPELQQASYEALGFERWRDRLSQRRVIHGQVSDFPAQERQFLSQLPVKALVVVPIFARDEWWGFMGFDDVESETEWDAAVIESLKTAAASLGAAIARGWDLEQVAKRERRFRSMVQHGGDIITILEADGTATYASPALERVMGFKPEKIIGQNIFDHVHPDDRSAAEAQFRALVAEPTQRMQTTLRLIGAAGEARTLEIVGTNLLDDAAVGGVVLNSRDITDRRRAEEELRQSEENYRSLFHSIPDPILVVDHERVITQVNPGFTRVFGWKAEELIGQNTRNIYPDQAEFERVGSVVEQAEREAGGQLEAAEVRLQRRTGEKFIGELSSYPLRNRQGVRIGSVGVFRDITERLQAQAALRTSEERYRSLFDSIRDAILVADKERRIVHFNPAFGEMFGYELEEIRGKPTVTIYKDPAEHRLLGQKIEELEKDGNSTVRTVTVNYRRKSGEIFPGETGIYSLLNSQGEIQGAIGLIRDVTERERRQREQAAVSQVAEALRSASNSEEMIPIILGQLMELMDAGGAEMVLTDNEQARLWVELGVGTWDKFTGLELKIPDDLAWQVLHRDKAFSTADLRGIEAFAKADQIGTDRAAAAVSMRAGEVPVGVIWVARPKPFLQDEIRVMKAIGDMAGNALRRAGLHEETQRRAEQLAAVSLLGQEMAENLDEFAIHERMVQASRRLLPDVSTVIVSRLNAVGEQFHCAYGEHEGEVIDIGELEPVPLEPPGRGCQSDAVHQRRPVFKNDLI